MRILSDIVCRGRCKARTFCAALHCRRLASKTLSDRCHLLSCDELCGRGCWARRGLNSAEKACMFIEGVPL